MTILSALQSMSTYPIPSAFIAKAGVESGINVDDDLTVEVTKSAPYKRIVACVYGFLAEAPNVSQGGVSYSFTGEEKARFRALAAQLRNEADGTGVGVYGWQGEDF